MGIKQGRDETFGSFIDKIASAIQRAGVPDYMKGTMLKQCALQNCNATTRSVLNTMGADWSIEEALDRLASISVGPQAMLVEAIKELGLGLKEQAQASQNQVLAALAPLKASAISNPRAPPSGRIKCYRCEGAGHVRRECQASGLWCQKCRSDSHNTTACRRRPGNSNASVSQHSRSRAQTQVAAANQHSATSTCNPPQQGASA